MAKGMTFYYGARKALTYIGTRKAFDVLRTLPRIDPTNVEALPGSNKRKNIRNTKSQKKGNKRLNVVPIGYEGGTVPFIMRFKKQSWNLNEHLKLAYIPVTVKQLQLMIDLERVRTDIPIDASQLSYSGLLELLRPLEKEGGYILQNEGLDCFEAEINLEVQWTTEEIIAAIERAGSTITTAYYDPFSLDAIRDPMKFFTKGVPIPKRMLPPQDLIEYYSDPKNRGYLADPDAIAEERFILAQKYGYKLPDIKKSPKYNMLIERKDPRQIFYGLQPGWIVNLAEKLILKPKDPELKEFYSL